MDLKNLVVESKTVTVEHPQFDGWKVELAYISKDKLKKLADRATTQKFNKRTHQPEDEIDSDMFLKIYTGELIKGWSGLKAKYLPELIPVNMANIDPEADVEYSADNALLLMQKSPDFDQWVSTVIGDVSNFNKSS